MRTRPFGGVSFSTVMPAALCIIFPVVCHVRSDHRLPRLREVENLCSDKLCALTYLFAQYRAPWEAAIS